MFGFNRKLKIFESGIIKYKNRLEKIFIVKVK